jgi:hypothetical protein
MQEELSVLISTVLPFGIDRVAKIIATTSGNFLVEISGDLHP